MRSRFFHFYQFVDFFLLGGLLVYLLLMETRCFKKVSIITSIMVLFPVMMKSQSMRRELVFRLEKYTILSS